MSKSLSRLWVVSGIVFCFGFQSSYRAGKQDVLRIEVSGESEFSREVTISDSGTINYAVLGEVKVDGLTVSEITDLIRKELMDRKILTQPSVSVTIKEYKSQSVTVIGEVKTPGKYYLKGSEILLDVLAEAGAVTPLAGEITISRTSPKGNQMVSIKGAEILNDRTFMMSGDVILVRPREISQVFVSGEVMTARALTYAEGLTVSQAILMAGGLNRFGNKSKVTVRRTENGQEKIVKVNLAKIEKGQEKDMPLLANDQIIVGRRVF